MLPTLPFILGWTLEIHGLRKRTSQAQSGGADRGKTGAVGSQREGPPREGQSGETLKKRVSQTEAQPTEAERKEERQGSGSSMQESSVPFGGMNLNLDGGEVKAADGKVEGRVLFTKESGSHQASDFTELR